MSVVDGLYVVKKFCEISDIDETFSGCIYACDGSSSAPVNWGRELVYTINLALEFPYANILSFTVMGNEPVEICTKAEEDCGIPKDIFFPTEAKRFKQLLEEKSTNGSYVDLVYKIDKALEEGKLPLYKLPGNLVSPPVPDRILDYLGEEFSRIADSSCSYSDFILRSKNFILHYLQQTAQEVFGETGHVEENRPFEFSMSQRLVSMSVSEFIEFIREQSRIKRLLGLDEMTHVLKYVCPFCAPNMPSNAATHTLTTEGYHVRPTKYDRKKSGRHIGCRSHVIYFDSDTKISAALSNGAGLGGYAIYSSVSQSVVDSDPEMAVFLRNYKNGSPYTNFMGIKAKGRVTGEYCLVEESQKDQEISISGFKLYTIVKNWREYGDKTLLETLFRSPRICEDEKVIWQINEKSITRMA